MNYMHPYFTPYDDETLDVIEKSLDREAFPERWASLQAELARRARATRSVYMVPNGGVISARGTFLSKWIFPAFFLGFTIFWTVGVYTWPRKGADGPVPPLKVSESPIPLLIGLGLFLGGSYHFVRYHSRLKRVEWVPGGLEVSDERVRIFVPFAAISAIEQVTNNTFRFATVHLNEDTPFGRQFTFLPHPDWSLLPSRKEDRVVTEVRKMVRSSYRGG